MQQPRAVNARTQGAEPLADVPVRVREVAPGVRWAAALGERQPASGDAVRLMARPEALSLVRAQDDDAARGLGNVAEPPSRPTEPPEATWATGATGALQGTVTARRFAGATAFYSVTAETPAGPVELLVQGPPAAAVEGQAVLVRPAAALRAFQQADR